MAITSLSLVNQKLAHARAMLGLPSVASPPVNAAERLSIQAIQDAAVFHLACAYQHYLRELAENYRVKDTASITDVAALVSALAAMGKEPSEANELAQLNDQPDSWLSRLQAYYRTLWLPPKLMVEQKLDIQENLIPVRAIEPATDSDNIDIKTLVDWERAFNALLTRQRETSVEY